jgi:sugar lactone lactonase YvrE
MQQQLRFMEQRLRQLSLQQPVAERAESAVHFGNHGASNGLNHPFGVAFDHEGHVVVSDYVNCCVKVFHCGSGLLLRAISQQGVGSPLPPSSLAHQHGPAHDHLVAMGFESSLVLRALRAERGDEERAVNMLLSGDVPDQEVRARTGVMPCLRHVNRRQQADGAGHVYFNSPWGVALDGAGHLIVAENGAGCVQVLNYADGSHVRTIGSGQLGSPSGVAIDSDGNVVVHDGGGRGCIQIFRLSDGAHLRSVCIEQLSDSGAVAFDAEGSLLVTALDSIHVLNYSNGALLRIIGQPPTGADQSVAPAHRRPQPSARAERHQALGAGHALFINAQGVALDYAGHLVVVDSGNHCVQVLNYADGSLVRTIGSRGSGDGQFNSPHGVAIDEDGRIIVCDSANHRIQVLQ